MILNANTASKHKTAFRARKVIGTLENLAKVPYSPLIPERRQKKEGKRQPIPDTKQKTLMATQLQVEKQIKITLAFQE